MRRVFALVTSLVFVLSIASFISLEQNETEVYLLNKKQSSVKWVGKKKVVGDDHYGQIKFSEGRLEIEQGKLVGGSFVIDMKSITCDDLQDIDYNAKLVSHLKSEDFFDVKNYPSSTFNITSVEDSIVTGVLTIKAISDTISFPADLVVTDGKLAAKAVLSFDRTVFGVRYGSDSFFDNLGDKVIDDIVDLEVNIAAEK